MGVAAIVCFAYIVRAGYIMFTAFGDEAKYAQGKKTLLYALIGLAIAVASGFIIGFFVRLLGYSGTDPFKL
jgi:ABC-type nitrate/sulfonate/bicarbonate transport system permease component